MPLVSGTVFMEDTTDRKHEKHLDRSNARVAIGIGDLIGDVERCGIIS